MRKCCQRWPYTLALAGCFLWPATAAEPARVALMDFTTADNSYRSAVAAANFSAMLQAKSLATDGIEWVERDQLHMAEKELRITAGFASAAAALQVGKMVKADLLATGHFIMTPAGGRELRIEVIDLEHADVLAGATLSIKGLTNRPIEVSAAEVAAANDQLRFALRQALERNSRTKKRTIIAPLFFANTSSSRRLDHLETELQSALDNAASRQGIRLLQFSRAAAAAEESELIFAGLVEQDPVAWQKVADVYVWGQYEEVKPDEFAFEQTPVKFTLNLWAGGGELQTVTETATVSELPLLEARLVQRILAAAKAFKKQTISEDARQQVARQLLFRACDIQALFKQETYGQLAPSYLGTAQGQQLLRYQAKLLATAHFFVPESYLAHRLWLESFWSQSPPSFWQRLEQIRSYDDFDDKFGLISPANMESDFPPRGQWHYLGKPRAFDYKLEEDWLGVRNDVCNTIDGKDEMGIPVERMLGFPTDAPPEVLESWKTQIRDDFARRLFTMYERAIRADPPVPVLNAHLFIDYGFVLDLKDKTQRAKFVEDLWPAYLAAKNNPTARREYSAQEFDVYFTRGILAQIRQVFADVGRPEQAEALVAQLRQKVKIVVNPVAEAEAAEAHRQKLVSVNLLPPKLSPNSRDVIFPTTTTVNGVVALKFGSDVLWVSTRGGEMNLADPAWEYLVASHPQAALWQLQPGGTPQTLSAKIGKHSPITSFCLQGDRLWMTLEQDGVICFSPMTQALTRYGDKEGVLSRQMFTSALAADRIYLGGGEPANGKLNCADFSGLSWKSTDFIGPNQPQIKLLQLSGHHLLVNNQIYNLEDGSKRELSEVLNLGTPKPDNGPMPPPRFDILTAAADPHGLWLGTTLGLVSYNPDNGTQRHWRSSPGGYLVDSNGTAMTVTSHYHLSGSGSYVADTNNCAVATMVPTSRLPGAVTAVANDGDFLWVATTTRFDPSLSGNGIEGQWVDGYFVLTLRPGISTGKGGKKGNWRNMYVGGERNDILLLHKPTGRWVGYFPATSRVTGLAVSDEKLWVGLEDKGYVQEAAHSWQDQEVFAPSPLLEVQKTPLLSIPPDQWVSDTISENEIRSRTQEAIRVLRTPPATESPDPGAAAGERYEFLQRNFGRFVPVEFKKSSNGDAVVQRLSVRGHLMEHAGEYYCGFRFTFPTWLDGDFEWMYALAKTESEKDFTSAITFGLVQENGPWAEPESLRRDNLHNYRELRQQFPYSYSLNLEDFSKDQLQPGKTYCVWFALPEKNHPDIAFAMTIHSERGTNEIGVLPLH